MSANLSQICPNSTNTALRPLVLVAKRSYWLIVTTFSLIRKKSLPDPGQISCPHIQDTLYWHKTSQIVQFWAEPRFKTRFIEPIKYISCCKIQSSNQWTNRFIGQIAHPAFTARKSSYDMLLLRFVVSKGWMNQYQSDPPDSKLPIILMDSCTSWPSMIWKMFLIICMSRKFHDYHRLIILLCFPKLVSL